MNHIKEIIIRRTEPSDFASIRAIYAQEQAFSHTLQLPYPSDQMWANRLSNLPESDVYLVAQDSDNKEAPGKIIGELSLTTMKWARRKHVASLGMGVCQTYIRQGVGTKMLAAALDMADNWLNIIRVELSVYVDNKAAIGLYKKSGFVIEGTGKKYAFKNGEYIDVFFMARIRKN